MLAPEKRGFVQLVRVPKRLTPFSRNFSRGGWFSRWNNNRKRGRQTTQGHRGPPPSHYSQRSVGGQMSNQSRAPSHSGQSQRAESFYHRLETNQLSKTEVRMLFEENERLRERGTKDFPLHTRESFAWGQKVFGTTVFAAAALAVYYFYGRTPSPQHFGDNFEEILPEPDQDGSLGNNPEPSSRTLVTFEDVRGNEGAKEELRDIVHFLKDPKKFKEMRVGLPKGVLLTGPPGCGKTLMARALAGEAKVPFLSASGSSFDQMFVGLGAARIRKLFKRARDLKPCIIFIDELDALGERRDDPRNYSKMTLNQLLTEMDGFVQNSGIIVLASTNMPNLLDPALVRSGRFDRQVAISLPDKVARKEIIELYLKNKPRDENLDMMQFAAETQGLSGSDLNNVINLAGIEAVKSDQNKITMSLLREAVKVLSLGRPKQPAVKQEKGQRITAYHEAGHALVSLLTPGSPPLSYVTITRRGRALGHASFIPVEHQEEYKTKEEIMADIDIAMGGRVAEEIIFGKEQVTTGASSDFNNAQRLAREMVMTLGMSKFGPMHFDGRNVDSETNAKINHEVGIILQKSYKRVQKLLLEHEKALHRFANKLLEKETLDSGEINDIVRIKS